MRKTIIVALGVMFIVVMAAHGLDVGDKAPPVTVKKWIVGKPVTPNKPDGKTIYVVEFWATWCPPCLTTIPHLNKLHKELKDKGVVIIGISDESTAKVAPFAKKLKMKYRVAVDKDRATNRAYMKGVDGIPHAFVIGKDGKVAWHGHPMDGMDSVIKSLAASTFDPAAAEKVAKTKKSLEEAFRAQDLERALKAVATLIALEPQNYEHFSVQAQLLAYQNNVAAIREARKQTAKRFADSAENLDRLAWNIISDQNLAARDPQLAFTCTQKAVDLTDHKNADHLATLARAYYELCLLDKAIATQKQALSVAPKAGNKARLNADLKYYESVKAIRDKITTAL